MTNIIVLIILVGLIVWATKFNKQNIASRVAGAKTSSQLPELAGMLGLSHEDISSPSKSNTIANVGEKISGTYKGVPLEIIMSMESETTGGYKSFSYKIQKTTTFELANQENKSFQILPKQDGVEGAQTGNAEFDAKLFFSGDMILSNEFLSACAKYGWMNLRLKGNKLIFNDDYMETQIGNKMTGIGAMGISHPILKYSTTNNQMDLNEYKNLIDLIIEEITATKLI